MRKSTLLFSLFFFLVFPLSLQSQIPNTISYEGVLQKDGKYFQGNATFVFTLFKGNSIAWKSVPKEIQVTNGLFGTVLGPFDDSMNFYGVDSLGITYDGIELSPKAAFTSVAYSLSAFHARIADSTTQPGPKGDKGDLGIAGAKGDKGEIGDQGISGIQGLLGPKGELGNAGLKGDKGDLGDAGIKGDKGLDGSSGVQGLKGDKGDIGVQGASGPQGLLGLKGDLGNAGIKGDKGDIGIQGTSGPQGQLGLKGDAGITGDKGLDGSSGAQGLKGDQGDIGNQGSKGDSGTIGPRGLTGNIGSQGVAGVKGDQGTKGDQGLKGDSGIFGVQGEKGVKGDKGTNPVSLTEVSQSANIFSLNDVALVRSGDALTLRLVNSTSPVLDATYSAFWHTTSAVGTGNGMIAGGTQVVFDVHLAYQFSIMVKVGNQWGKIDLFRVDLAATDWYGSWTSN